MNDMTIRQRFAWIRFLEDCRDSCQNKDAAERFLIREKRELRALLKKRDRASAAKRIVKDDGIDGFIVRIEFPEFIKTKEEAEAYFRQYEYIEPYYTYHDCTGRAFTSWYRLFLLNGVWTAYHSVRFDV